MTKRTPNMNNTQIHI